MRAMWITRFQLDSKDKIDRFIKIAKENNFNNIFVQVVGRGQGYYDSSVIPKIPLDFDPLEYIVEKSHKNNIKVHAWLNAYYVWSSAELPDDPNHVVNKHPQWLIPSNSQMKFLNPANNEVKNYLFDMYYEVVKKYDIDGIHFDYIRYDGYYYGLDRQTRENFARTYFVDPFYIVYFPQAVKYYYGEQKYNYLKQKWIEYKCEQVSELVRDLSIAVKSLNKNILISAAVYGDLQTAIESKSQNWPLWLKKGWIDFAVPMLYTTDNDILQKRISHIIKMVDGKKIVIGLGPYLMSPEEFYKQYKTYKEYKNKNSSIIGFNLFSYDAIFSNQKYFSIFKK